MDELEGLLNILPSDLEVGDWLGNGCSGVVFKGTWLNEGQKIPVAIKKMRVSDSDILREICREFKTMQSLPFENICKVYGGCLVNNGEQVWLVMEYVDGGDLHTFLTKKTDPLSYDLQLSFCIQATKALASLHNAPSPILHRDIKSLNFLVQDKSKILLTDFGLSKAKALTTSSTFTIGTVRWAAPEIVGMKKPQWSDKADIYSLGMVFYEIATRLLPYHELSNLAEILKKIKSGTQPKYPPNCSKELKEIIYWCLHLKPAKRPNVNELLETLEKLESLKVADILRSSIEYKIVVMGPEDVGKSALTVRLFSGVFVPKYDPTIEDSYRKQVEIDGQPCILDIMDTAGQEEHSALRDQYMKTGEGFVLVYSITSTASFSAAQKIRNSILRVKDDSTMPIMLVGNNSHLESERTVLTEEAKLLADKWGAGFIEASAKTNTNVNEIFFQLVRLINKWRENNPQKMHLRRSQTCVVL